MMDEHAYIRSYGMTNLSPTSLYNYKIKPCLGQARVLLNLIIQKSECDVSKENLYKYFHPRLNTLVPGGGAAKMQLLFLLLQNILNF